jgi:Na+/H+-dicarboxylate symporter
MWRYLIPMVLIPTVASADPVSAAVAFISSAGAVGISAIATSAFWTHFATTFALSTAAKLLAPDVKDVNAGNNWLITRSRPRDCLWQNEGRRCDCLQGNNEQQ